MMLQLQSLHVLSKSIYYNCLWQDRRLKQPGHIYPLFFIKFGYVITLTQNIFQSIFFKTKFCIKQTMFTHEINTPTIQYICKLGYQLIMTDNGSRIGHLTLVPCIHKHTFHLYRHVNSFEVQNSFGILQKSNLIKPKTYLYLFIVLSESTIELLTNKDCTVAVP